MENQRAVDAVRLSEAERLRREVATLQAKIEHLQRVAETARPDAGQRETSAARQVLAAAERAQEFAASDPPPAGC